MSNIKKNRTGLRLLGNRRVRFTMNKTQQNQPVYSKVQPRCPGSKGNKAGQICKGSNTNVGCKTCYGCVYTFDVSSNAFRGAYPTYGSFASVNLLVDSSANEPCEWQYNAIVESIAFPTPSGTNTGARVTLNIEDEKCINASSIEGVYFYAPVGGTLGVYTGRYRVCTGVNAQGIKTYRTEDSQYLFDNNTVTQIGPYPNDAKRMGAPYRNPIAGWRNSLDCNYKDCSSNDVGTSNWGRQPTNTVYKDNYSGKKTDDGTIGCCPTDCSSNKMVHRPGIQGRTHRPIIRSGMQEKNNCCKGPKGKCSNKNDYSFSYRQYQNNKRCLSFERSQEKYVGRYACYGPDGKCQNKFRKSGCAACCTCCVKVQNMKFSTSTPVPLPLPITITQTINGEQVTGTVTEILDISPINGVIWYKVEVTDDKSNLCLGFQIGQARAKGTPVIIQGVATSMTTTSPGDCSNKGNLVTIYKPNNKKFSKQGAVSSGSRLDRLKLDTIKSGNSKCKKGKGRCRTIKSKFIDGGVYKVPNGKYDAGRPRFTGWMFNGHHREVKSRVYNMVRYNQQPLGIPQLTAHRLTLSQGGNGCGTKKCFPRTLNLGSNRATAAGNRARIPGSKCVICCIVRVYGNAGGSTPAPSGPFSGLVPGTILYQVSTGYTGTVIEQVPDPTGSGGEWGWLTIRFNGQCNTCEEPALTTGAPSILTTSPSGVGAGVNGIKVAEVSGFLDKCDNCYNIPNQTGQGLPVC